MLLLVFTAGSIAACSEFPGIRVGSLDPCTPVLMKMRNHACVPYHATLQGLARGSLGTSGFTIRIVPAASLAPGSWHLAPAVAADSILQAVQIFRLKGLQCSR